MRAAEKLLNRHPSTLCRLAKRANLRRRRAGLPPGKKKKLLRLLSQGVKPYQAALQTPVSTRTAWAYSHLENLRTLTRRANKPLPCRPWRCPIDGALINLTICIVHGTRKPPRAAKPRS